MQQSESLIDPIVLAIIVVEIVAFLFQFLYYLERPSDKSRRLYLILLFMLIVYNITGGLVPNYDSSIPLEIQYTIGHISAIAMSMYFIYYIYETFNLAHLRWLSTRGVWYFLFVPFLVFDVVLFATGDIRFSQMILLPIPTLYGLYFVYRVIRFLVHKYDQTEPSQRRDYRIYLFSVISAISCWVLLPFIIFFNMNNVIEHVSTNLGLMFMTAVYIQSLVRDAQNEYQRLLVSERKNKELISSLEETNALLSNTIKNREKVIEERTEALKLAITQQRNNFVNLAHETKTPLTLIHNYLSDYIAKYGVNEELSVIRYNVEKLITDIVNYFDIERLDKGVNIYDHEQTANFSGILTNGLSLFKPLAANKKIQLLDDLEESVLVQADPDALVRIVNNIVENAIKYTSAGGRISVMLYTEEGRAVFKVSDSGRGIPKHLRAKVLRPYFQASQKKRGSEGIGMGLSIVNKIVESLSGTIELSSNTVRGLIVKISLPVNEDADQIVDIASPRVGQSKILPDVAPVQDVVGDTQRPSILVVEDHVSMLRYLTDKLSEEYNVYAALDGREALQKLKMIDHLDLIISDVMMDNVDGFKFGEIIKRNPNYSHIPLLYLTAKSRGANEMISLKLGALGFIEKPFKLPILLQKVRSVIENSRNLNRALIGQIQSGFRLNHSNGQSHFNPSDDNGQTTNGVMSHSVDLTVTYKKYDLSNKEVEVVELLKEGFTNKEIADQMNISDKTVMTHVRNIFTKIGVNRRGDVIKKLYEEARN
ncbi:ATP-binding protein [Tunicatimonas pelagia]|uniref:ATP-binding protein n=1 Tax=Tunicatimonas pelagia TaxID=931531 RepID=UPI0026668B20|nr:ATP-binding protein [Tunicatimonas pelagia]WKN46460.1 ATP-binding protein [Tunicatimonas pelagia]